MWGTVVVPVAPAADPARSVVVEAVVAKPPSALLEASDDELMSRVSVDPSSLGSLSIGAPSSAVLINAVQLPADPMWQVAPSAETWGTAETMESIRTAVSTVHQLYPDTPPIFVGDISDADGGHLHRHQTHQGGRDADLGYYYLPGKGTWFTPGASTNLDMPRNWALVRAIVVCTDVETILLDTRIQRLLYQYALKNGEDKAWLDRIFGFVSGSPNAIIRHVTGHRTHYHVRFYSPIAQELGRRVHPMLVAQKLMKPPAFTIPHVVQPGQTLGALASRYGTSVRAIMQANGLTSSQVRAGRTYRIPVRTPAPQQMLAFTFPHRTLPTVTPEVLAAVPWPTPESLYGTGGDR